MNQKFLKVFVAGSFLIGVVAAVQPTGQLQSPGTQPKNPGTLVAKYPGSKAMPAVDCAGEYDRKCSDCRNIAVCAGERSPVSTQSCASFNPANPYCVNGACQSETAPDSGVCGAEFRCSSEGYFPHPNDCSKYYFCDKINGEAYEYSCGENRVYLSRQKTCANRTAETDCHTINCKEASNSFIQYSPHLAYYAFCAETDGRKETILYKCPDEDTSEFDMETLSCTYRCPGEGRYLNPGNCASFYECYKAGADYQAIKWSCPMGFRYSNMMQRCEIGMCPQI